MLHIHVEKIEEVIKNDPTLLSLDLYELILVEEVLLYLHTVNNSKRVLKIISLR